MASAAAVKIIMTLMSDSPPRCRVGEYILMYRKPLFHFSAVRFALEGYKNLLLSQQRPYKVPAVRKTTLLTSPDGTKNTASIHGIAIFLLSRGHHDDNRTAEDKERKEQETRSRIDFC